MQCDSPGRPRSCSSDTYDGLGRLSQTSVRETASSYIVTTTEYDALGRVWKKSNPVRGTPVESDKTQFSYDALGHLVTTTYPDGAQTRNDFDANQTTMTDPAGNGKRISLDAFGRMTDVWEAPTGLNHHTRYSYDVLGNLAQVCQHLTSACGQVRTFSYDELNRLTSAIGPESNGLATNYAYDSNGNLAAKTDPRGVVTCYGDWSGNSCNSSVDYDALNRVLRKSYSDSTPAVTYAWDTVFKGRLSSVANAASTTSYTAYDAVGRVTASSQSTNQHPYSSTQYSYNLAGGLTSLTYPSGRLVNTSYDGAGRVSGVTGGGTNAAYVSNVAYAAHGAIKNMLRGDGLTESWTYNSRMQPASISVGTAGSPTSALGLSLYYCSGKALSCSDNNGNLQTISLAVPSVDQSFKYDALNRVVAAAEQPSADMSVLAGDTTCATASFPSAWWQGYCYDAYGNRWANPSGALPNAAFTPTASSNYPDNTNRLFVNVPPGVSNPYDFGGNLTALGGYTFQYDAENRQIEANFNNGATPVASTGYRYDGDGHRVQKIACPAGTSACTASVSGATVTDYVYDAFGNLMAEYTLSGTAPAAPCATCYVSVDHLGSTRAVTDGTTGSVMERHDYLPFGEELYAGTGVRTTGLRYLTTSDPLSVRQRFTGKERDSETNLDYFGARYFSGAQGRFTSADPTFMTKARIGDPQQWNLYAYTRNNPLKYIDPDGRDMQLAAGVSAKDRSYIVTNLARLYMTDKGRAYMERVNNSPYVVDISAGKLPRVQLSPTSEHVTGGITRYETGADAGQKYLHAEGQPGAPDAFPAIQVVIDKGNTSDMGLDPATVFAHELGGHTSNVLDLAERDPNNPVITGLDPKQDEDASRQAEKVGKLPGKPTDDAVQAVERILKPKKEEQR